MFMPFTPADEKEVKNRNGSPGKNSLRRAFFNACAIKGDGSTQACAADQLWGDGTEELRKSWAGEVCDNMVDNMVSLLLLEVATEEVEQGW